MAARRRKKAARRKKKAARRGGRRKKAALNVVVGSKVKEAIKGHGVRCSGDMIEAVNAEVLKMLDAAVARCVANKRGTVRPQDL